MKMNRRSSLIAGAAFAACAALGHAEPAGAARALRYFPSAPVYAYRWKLLALALGRDAPGAQPVRLAPYAEDVTQNRGMLLLQSGAIDVVALGTNAARERDLLPIKIDILRGIVGLRLLVIRAADQARIARMDAPALRRELVFGLNSQSAALPILRGNDFTVRTSASYENLFQMLDAGRFDALLRGLDEARRELDARRRRYPQLALESTKALYYPYPVYFWVRRDNAALAARIERGLRLALADGSFRRLFAAHHAAEIAALRREKRQVIRLANPILPSGSAPPDTRWWWPDPPPASQASRRR